MAERKIDRQESDEDAATKSITLILSCNLPTRLQESVEPKFAKFNTDIPEVSPYITCFATETGSLNRDNDRKLSDEPETIKLNIDMSPAPPIFENPRIENEDPAQIASNILLASLNFTLLDSDVIELSRVQLRIDTLDPIAVKLKTDKECATFAQLRKDTELAAETKLSIDEVLDNSTLERIDIPDPTLRNFNIDQDVEPPGRLKARMDKDDPRSRLFSTDKDKQD